MSDEAVPLTSRGEATRQLILGRALELFREKGYDDTTMRAIAERAGVSLGNAYYYFRSKEHLIQGYYRQSHEQHLAAVEAPLEQERTLAARLRAVIRAKIETSEPYHRFAGQLFRTAADPESPLNPFSADSAPVREDAIALFGRVVDGADVKVPADLRAELPRLLWMWEMGIVLFWIHDRSEGRRRTFRLAERTADIVARLASLASSPLLRPLRRMALDLVRELAEDAPR
jgi:AcrR family transcriptional regulator